MIPYWILLFIPAFKALVNPKEKWNNQTAFSIIILISIFVGLRYKVGTDWGTYMIYLNIIDYLDNIFSQREFLFALINKISLSLDFGIYGVNFISAFIFSYGLVFFCRSLHRQWLALTISIPYMVIVVSMGYTRQSIALGLLMIGLVHLSKGKKFVYFLLTIVSSLFQLSGLVGIFLLFPYIIDSAKLINKIIYLFLSLVVLRIIYSLLISKFIASYIRIYFEQGVSSSGVFIRLFLICFPSIIFLLLGNKLLLERDEELIWKSISIYSLSLLGLVFILPSSTVVDRLALYALPIMIFTLSKLPELKLVKIRKINLNLIVVTFSCLTQFVWLNYAANAQDWMPYNNILFRLN